MTSRTAADLVVVGAGPTGLFAAYYGGFRGLTVTVIDAQPEPGGQVTALYPTKTIHDVAGFAGVTGAELVDGLVAQAMTYAPRMIASRNVVDVVRDDAVDGLVVTLDDGTAIDSRTLVLATGVGGIRPRTLPLGHGWHGRGVTYAVADPAAHAGEHAVVVGGGDSALDWALALQPHAASVTIVHRRRAFRAHQALVTRATALGVALLTETEIQAVHGDDRVRSVVLRAADGTEQEIAADIVVGALGLVTAPAPFGAWGIEMRERKIVVDTAMRTSLRGVFAAGDATTYPGKVPLMATGFGEAATAVNNAAVIVDPDLTLAPGHSTDEDDAANQRNGGEG